MDSTVQNYSLIVPFSTNSNKNISLNNSPLEFMTNSYELSIKGNGVTSYSLKVGLFESEKEAASFFQKIKIALHWVTLKHKIGIVIPNNISNVKLYENPIEVKEDSLFYALGYRYLDGDYDGNNAVIICNQKNIVCITGHTPSITVGIGAENLATTLTESLAYNGSENIQKDRKLRLALELYSNYFFEHSQYARFITLVNVLEALAPSENENKISSISQNGVDEAKKCVVEICNNYNEKSQEYKDLKDLIERIDFLKNQKVISSLKNYVANTLGSKSMFGKRKDIRSNVYNAYKLRSNLLHGEEIDQNNLIQQLSFLDLLIPELLKIEYLQKIKLE